MVLGFRRSLYGGSCKSCGIEIAIMGWDNKQCPFCIKGIRKHESYKDFVNDIKTRGVNFDF